MKSRRKSKFIPKWICITDDNCQAALQGRSASVRKAAISQIAWQKPRLPSSVVALSPGKPFKKKLGWIITCSVNNLGIHPKAYIIPLLLNQIQYNFAHLPKFSQPRYNLPTQVTHVRHMCSQKAIHYLHNFCKWVTPVLTHERGQKWVPELASPFRADTNLWSDSAPCLSGEWGQLAQTKLVRSWKQWNICWYCTSLCSITSSQCNLSIFFPVQLRQNYKNVKNGLPGQSNGPFGSWMVEDACQAPANLRTLSNPFLSSIFPPPPMPPKTAYGMLEGTSLPVAWRISYTTCYINKLQNSVTHHAFHF